MNILSILSRLFRKFHPRSSNELQVKIYSKNGISEQHFELISNIVKQNINSGIPLSSTAITLNSIMGGDVIINIKQNVVEIIF